jgi:predicted nucleotide-binding protein (sugar kinase/HSP70/actin superfamily)
MKENHYFIFIKMNRSKLTLKFLKELFTKDDEILIDEIFSTFADNINDEMEYLSLSTFNKKLSHLKRYLDDYDITLDRFQPMVSTAIAEIMPEGDERGIEINEGIAAELAAKQQKKTKKAKIDIVEEVSPVEILFPQTPPKQQEVSLKLLKKSYQQTTPHYKH